MDLKYLLIGLVFIVIVESNLITVNEATYTYTFSQSTTLQIWTAPNAQRIRNTNTTAPTAKNNTLYVYCGREEQESYQLIIAPTTIASMTVKFSNFAGLPSTSWIDVGVCEFSPVSAWAQGNYSVTDYTNKITTGAKVSLSATLPTVLWFTVYVPGSTCGKKTYSTTITITPLGNSAVSIPAHLYVFNVLLPLSPSIDTYFQSTPLFTDGDYSLAQLDTLKQTYLQHRLDMRDGAWSGGLDYDVAWTGGPDLVDCDNATSTQSCIWANGCLAQRYVLGQGGWWRGVFYENWIGTGYSQLEAFNTDEGRPDTFNNIPCGTNPDWVGGNWTGWMCSPEYEAAFGAYMLAVYNYLESYGFYASPTSTKGYYYTLNEPQIWSDYTIAAYLGTLAHQYAPGLKTMVSREAHPWIYDHPTLPIGYSIWIAFVNRFPAARTWARQANFGETSWIYFLDTDGVCSSPGICGPVLAPFVSASGCNCGDALSVNDGMNYRAIPWTLFSLRVSGFGYYLDSIYWDTRYCCNSTENYAPPRPRVAAALIREGMEDYEYLYQANCNQRPAVYTQSYVDLTANSIGYTQYTWNHDPASAQAVRNELGHYLEGTRPDMPYLVAPPTRPFGDYYIDWASDPTNSNAEFEAGGLTWITSDINQNYDVAKGIGFQAPGQGTYNPYYESPTFWLYCNGPPGTDYYWEGPPATHCYDNSNHPVAFWFAIAPGVYNVTVALGWQGKDRNGDVEYVEVNNVLIRNFTCTPGVCVGVREYSSLVNVSSHGSGGVLIATLGSPYINSYTIFAYMKIVGVSSAPVVYGPSCTPSVPSPCVPNSPSPSPSKSHTPSVTHSPSKKASATRSKTPVGLSTTPSRSASPKT